MTKILSIGFILFLGANSWAQRQKKVQFIGGARSLMTHTDFKSESNDTTTAPKTNSGYALFDFGVKINPNQNTEVVGMFRINNRFGGFWGGGVDFGVRQLYVRGVAANVLRYQIGNIDYKLTPYTLYNHNPDMLLNSFGTNAVKEDVIDYETFYNRDGTWRQQGAAINFGLQFPKAIRSLEVNGFMTRVNPSDFSAVLERLQGGGNIIIDQSKWAKVGFNFISLFDLKGTANNGHAYRNNVGTMTFDFSYDQKKFEAGIDGETGLSSSFFIDTNTNLLSDYFIHTRAYFNLLEPEMDLNFELGYLDNGADFRSFGAQSKRVDFNQFNNFYRRFTNDQIIRPLSVFDLYNDPGLYSTQSQVGVMEYNPSINNALPYGLATFNRRGVYLGANYSDSLGIIKASIKYHALQEIRGQGTLSKKRFNMAALNAEFNLSNWMRWDKNTVFNLGLSVQNTARKSDLEFEQIDLNSVMISAGFDFEVIPKLHILGNYLMFSSKGNDLLPIRDTDGSILNFAEYQVDGMEQNIAGGLKFDFSKNIYLTAFYEQNTNRFITGLPYKYNQFSIYYVMKI